MALRTRIALTGTITVGEVKTEGQALVVCVILMATVTVTGIEIRIEDQYQALGLAVTVDRILPLAEYRDRDRGGETRGVIAGAGLTPALL